MGNDLLGTTNDGRLTLGSRTTIGLNRFAARRAAAVIVKSDEMAAVLSGSKAHVIPNGVDMVRFAPIDRPTARDRLCWPRDGLVALFPGCPDFPNKGYDIARDAVAHAAERLGRPVSIKVLWKVAPADVPLYMSGCDAMILASQQEGSPNVVKEALACELPIVATAVGDVPELLRDAEGCHVRARNAASLGEVLALALPIGRLRVGRTILLTRQLDEDSVAKRLVALYHAVIEQSEPRG